MDDIEAKFRNTEKILDQLLKTEEQPLLAQDVKIEDRSARTYHYKNQYLFWSHSFRKEWLVEAERACVTVHLSSGEPIQSNDPPIVKLDWRAELYSQGKESRIDKRHEESYSLAEIERAGITRLVMKAIQEGAACLPSAR